MYLTDAIQERNFSDLKRWSNGLIGKVFYRLDPKDSKSYLYLAKIYKEKDNKKKEEKNLESTLLIDPANEEAILMLMEIALEKTNYSKVKNNVQKSIDS